MFKLMRGNQLSKEHFEEYPVWSEYYDFEEFEEIVSWGISREWLDQELKDKHDGSEHCVYTLLQTNPFPDRMRIFIKAEFQTCAGIKLDGYIVNEDAYCVGIFVGAARYIFNDHPMMRELNEKESIRLQQVLGNSQGQIFPLRYVTDFFNSDGQRIQGVFQPEIRSHLEKPIC